MVWVKLEYSFSYICAIELFHAFILVYLELYLDHGIHGLVILVCTVYKGISASVLRLKILSKTQPVIFKHRSGNVSVIKLPLLCECVDIPSFMQKVYANVIYRCFFLRLGRSQDISVIFSTSVLLSVAVTSLRA